MKKIQAIFLVSIYMFSFSELHQILRLPVLAEHFKEHQALDPNISFFAFLKLHYVGKIEVDDDYQRDQQLPFRAAECAACNITCSCECPEGWQVQRQPSLPKPEFRVFNDESKPTLSITDIFQPPRQLS